MRKRLLTLLTAFISLIALCPAQETALPFASVDAAFKKNRLRWSLASVPFQQERTRLGQNFEPELWKYLGTDVDKQDRIANFLLYPEYLHGSLPMPFLAMQIQTKTLSLLESKTDLSSRTDYVTASINAAILAGSLELIAEAETHKKNAEAAIAGNKFLITAFPAIDDYDRCIYDSIGNHSIPSPATACLGKKSSSEANVASVELVEIPAKMFVANPQPSKTAGQSGKVTVEVVVDENGKVESAEPISGPADLQAAAVKAAQKARFQKTLYRGQAVKVRGPITYQF